MDKHTVYIGVGSNLDNPQQQVTTAIEDLKAITEFNFITTSSLYKTPPMGPQDQPDYINAVTKISSGISATAVLDKLQEIEQLHGRVRETRWGPRSLDLDILLYGDQVIDIPRLKIPHPGLNLRAFVLYPLVEIEPKFTLPNGILLTKQIALLGKHDIVKLI